MRKWWFAVIVGLMISILGVVYPARAQVNPLSDQELVEKYAPVLYFHPIEFYRPQRVDAFLRNARLRQARTLWFDINVIPKVSMADLPGFKTMAFFLDAWYGSEFISDSKNYSYQREYYADHLSPQVGGPPVSAYAHVNRSENPGYITIQYWLFYYYNDWFNKHEGDWEMVEVILDQSEQPLWLVLSQHHGGTRRAWDTSRIENGTHPAVYVALGSHANYFRGDEVYPNGMDIGSAHIEILDHTGTAGRVIPEVALVPDPAQLEEDSSGWPGMEWLLFGGHWGETAQQSDFGGPIGPAFKGAQWDEPYAWGVAQPLDVQTWYSQRLRIQLVGSGQFGGFQSSNSELLSSLEVIGDTSVFHNDLLAGEKVVVDLKITANSSAILAVTVPDPSGSRVTQYRYDLPFSAAGRSLSITLANAEAPGFRSEGEPIQLDPAMKEIKSFNWNNPDLIWMPGLLPAVDILKGVLFSLLAGWIPALLLAAFLYQVDRYEKEPMKLLVIPFLWGAIPALFLSIVLRIFVLLPPEVQGVNAIQAVWGWLSGPIVEEALKGIVILFIALRKRQEFDDILDGILYGALVGIGFAMNSNIISYLGSFLTRGFSGFSPVILGQGIVSGLNQALYSAIFGASLGYARLAVKRWQRRLVPTAAFLAAVCIHTTHDLLLRSSVGLNAGSVILSLMGVLVLMAAALVASEQQRRLLWVELCDVLPDALLQGMIHPGRRFMIGLKTMLRDGLGTWRRKRWFYRLCAEFAFKQMQARRFPEEEQIAKEMWSLRDQVNAYLLEQP